MWEIPRIWDGGQCIIIGGGSSIPHQFDVPIDVIEQVYKGSSSPEVYSPYMESIHDQHIIAVNMAYTLGSWVDCAFFGDAGFLIKRQMELLEWSGLRITSAVKMEPYQGRLKVVARDDKKKLGISLEPNKICWNHNSGAAAINLAVHFGVKRIILLGFDMKLDANNNQHWHKFYTTSLKVVPHTMKRHMMCFPTIAEDLRSIEVEIINCSPDSMIEAFPKINFKDIKL